MYKLISTNYKYYKLLGMALMYGWFHIVAVDL